MSISDAREYLKRWNKQDEIIEFSISSATVELAAIALNTKEERIAKSLSFLIDNKAIIIVTAGNVKIDNRKYKDEFGCKSIMLTPDQAKNLIGHEVGGICPFGIKNGVDVYLDRSLMKYDYVFPACGSSSSAIKMKINELEEISNSKKWIDVCKTRE